MFQPRWKPLILGGQKTNTIRPPKKRKLQPGDILSARVWTGKAYRSDQEEFAHIEVVAADLVTILEHGII
jgi:uncharacterized protein YqfB (UPF0267 family)